jgi:uncharacterized protein
MERNVYSSFKCALKYKREHQVDKYFMTMTALADKGYCRAQECLMNDYYEFYDNGQDYSMMKIFYENNQDGSWSCNYLGMIHKLGHGCEKNQEKAIELFQKAAKMGNVWSLFELAHAYLNGIFVDKDVNKAVKMLEFAAEKGHIYAMYRLGTIYNGGHGGIKHDLEKAITYHKMAASKGLDLSLSELTRIYRNAGESRCQDGIHFLYSINQFNKIKDVYNISNDKMKNLCELINNKNKLAVDDDDSAIIGKRILQY